mgnify:FL=1
MPNDLERNLIAGGLNPAAAKVISNAIANVATGKTSLGRQLADATPSQSMRLIDSDARRYVLTNLDHPADAGFRSRLESTASQYAPNNDAHPYQNSQPASSNPTISTPEIGRAHV